jgi:hypothetical protein
MKLSERETVDNKQEQAREDKRCTKEAQEADKDAGRQGKWKRNKEVEERNGAGLLRSRVVS